jgi:regulator of protease activity HflC (stomatin/prohibitin superfamily)
LFELLNSIVIPDTKIKFKHILMGIFIFFTLILTNCSFRRVKIDAGEQGVIVSQPYIFGSGGVSDTVLHTGGYWVWKSNAVYGIRILPQQVSEDFKDMMSGDSIPVQFDAHLNYRIIDPVVYWRSWGEHWYSSNIQQTFRTVARDECKRYTMSSLITNPDTTRAIELKILEAVQKYAAEKKMPIEFTKVNIGKINPKDDVMAEIGQTAVQQQRQRTELDRKKAEDNRRMTEVSRAAADNAYREAMNLAPEQYIRLEAVKAYSHAAEECAKNDKCTMILTQPGNEVKATIPAR